MRRVQACLPPSAETHAALGRRTLPGLLGLLFFMAWLWGAPVLDGRAWAAAKPESAKILLLYSYGYGGKGTESFNEAFRATINQAGIGANDLLFEYLDIERNRHEPQYRQQLRQLLLLKHARRNIGLIVVVQEPALDFLLREGREIAPRAPVVLVQARMPDLAAADRQIIGQQTHVDIKGTLQRAFEIFPRTEQVLFVAGDSRADREMATEAMAAAKFWQGKVGFANSGDLSLDQLLDKVAHLPRHTIIIFLQYHRDSHGRIALSSEMEENLVRVANAPVFGLYDFNLANGGIGGSVVSLKALGAHSGRMAVAVLAGTTPPPRSSGDTDTAIVPMFNWKQLQRWRGETGRLPKESLFIERPSTIWQDHRELIIGALIIFLLQSLTIACLIISRRRRKAVEKLLHESEGHYRSRLAVVLEHKHRHEEGLELLLDLNQHAHGMTERQICNRGVDIAVKTSRSERGYLRLIDDEPPGRVLAVSTPVEPPEPCRRPGEASSASAVATMTLDGDETRRAYLHNEGPAGAAHMCAPAFDGNRAHLLIHVAKASSDYEDENLRQLQMVANEVLKIVMRRRTEESLRESEARFRFIIDLSPGMVWVADADMMCSWVNSTWRNFTGCTLTQALGQGWTDSIHPDDVAANLAGLTAHMAARVPFVAEYRIRRHDGEYRWVLDSGQPRFDDADEFKGYVGTCLDITERKQAEVDRELFRTFFTLSLDMMCITGADGYFKQVNPAFTRVLGYSETELLARPVADFVIPSDRQKTRDEVMSLLAGKHSVNFENHYGCRDGAIKQMSWHAFADPEYQVIYATARDVTAQRAAEDQLLKLWLAVEQTSHSIIITDTDARIEYVNRAFCEISGYAAEEMIGQNPRLLQSGVTPGATYGEMWRALRQGKVWQGSLTNRRKNGELYIEAVRISPVRQPDGRITHYLAIKEDVTEQTRATDAIRESKWLLQRVIDSTPDWIYVKDRQHRFLLVNECAAAAFNQTPERMIGHRDTEFLPEALDKTGREMILPSLHADDDAVFAGQSIHNSCEKISFENGEIRVFDTFKGPLRDSSQHIYGVLCYRRDVTERFNTEQAQKALENQLRQAQKLELIGHLTGGVAHDFNNILTSICGYAELIQMAPDIEQTPRLAQYLQEILQAGIRAKELVAQLLTFSQKKEVAAEALRVAPVVKEVVKLLRATLPSSISIAVDIARKLPEVLMSPVHLHQVLMNLGVNARDAIAEAGHIAVKISPVTLATVTTCSSCHAQFSGHYLMISVADNGCGIVVENLPKIFDPFFSTKEVGRGSGLGLSVLHGIVHSASGHIEAVSGPNTGTEFRVYLPAQAAGVEPRFLDAQPKLELKPLCGTVMVVDDEPSIVGFITELLRGIGCRVIGLTRASEAWQIFENDPNDIDLVITDQTMPELSGAELAHAMLARRPDLPIVLVTGYSNVIDETAARKMGIHRLLLKPIPAKLLIDIVTTCLAAKPAGEY